MSGGTVADRLASRINAATCWRLVERISLIILGAIVLLLFLLTLVPANLQPAIVYPELPIPLVRRDLRPGDPLTLNATVCNHTIRPFPVVSTQVLVRSDGTRFNLPNTSILSLPGCHRWRIDVFVLPDDLPPGVYSYEGVASSHGLAARQVDVYWFTEDFVVMEK
jgi:uncharacterized protein (DUF58 family)